MVSYKWLLLFSSLLFLASCYQGKEGCTDPLARNYDPEADQNVGCTYFRMQMELSHVGVYAGTTYDFSYNAVVSDALGDTFKVAAFPFLLSNMRLVRADGTEFGVLNKVLLTTPNGTVEVEDNFAVCDRNTFVADFGDVNYLDTFVSVKFNVGLPATVNHSDGSLLESTHPLYSLQAARLYQNPTDGYIFMKPSIYIMADTVPTLFAVSGDANMVPVELPFATAYVLNGNMDARVRVSLDYFRLFSGISFRNDAADVVKAKLVANAAAAFFLTP